MGMGSLNVPKKRQANVDEEISSTSCYHPNTDWRNCSLISFPFPDSKNGMLTQNGDNHQDNCRCDAHDFCIVCVLICMDLS